MDETRFSTLFYGGSLSNRDRDKMTPASHNAIALLSQQGKVDEKSCCNPVHIPPQSYVHVTNTNNHVARVIVGPTTYTLQDAEQLTLGPVPLVQLGNCWYCVIKNPILTNPTGDPIFDNVTGMPKLKHGSQELRFSCPPFPLYPGEVLVGQIKPYKIIPHDVALILTSSEDFDDKVGSAVIKRHAGEPWLLKGPTTYPLPPWVQAKEAQSVVLSSNQSLLLRSETTHTDFDGIARRAGEEWLVSQEGLYFIHPEETLVSTLTAYAITHSMCLHLRAKRTFIDQFNIERQAGSEWLISDQETSSYTPTTNEDVVGIERPVVLTSNRFAVIVNPVGENGESQLGKMKQIKGPCSFFLQPGESLLGGQLFEMILLQPEDAAELRSVCHHDGHLPGSKWWVYGPELLMPGLSDHVTGVYSALINAGTYHFGYWWPKNNPLHDYRP